MQILWVAIDENRKIFIDFDFGIVTEILELFGAEIVSRKSDTAKQSIIQHSKDFGGTLNDQEVIKLIGNISRNTYYKYKKELKE